MNDLKLILYLFGVPLEIESGRGEGAYSRDLT